VRWLQTGGVTKTDAAIAQLRSTVAGQVIVPGDDGYDTARTVYLGGMNQRPAAIVRPANADDVSRVVTVARDNDVPLAVKGGGHSMFCLCDGGIVLDMASMNDLQIDVESRTAWAEGGLTAGGYTSAAHEYGLATGFGDSGTVGLGGITTGGGIGYLVRKHGLTVDDLLAAEIVTADGQLHQVDVDHEPDLFWAIRGGGGNFGVVTRMRFRMHEISTVFGGWLVLPATAEVIAGFTKHAQQASEDLTTIVNIMPSPPMPFVPAEWHGKPIVMAMLLFAGDAEAGEQAVAPFRALDTPIADLIGPMPYPRIYPPPQEDYHPVSVGRNLFVDGIDIDVAAMILERIAASTAVMPAVQVRVLGGALTRHAADSTAFAHRHRNIMINLAAIYQNPDDVDVHTRWVNEFTLALQDGVTGAYVNFLADDSAARIQEAYPGDTWTRLRAIKRTYDPTNLFRGNANIPPAEG